MIRFPSFGEYSSGSQSYTSRHARGSITLLVAPEFQPRRTKKSKKSILMELLVVDDWSEDEDYGLRPRMVVPWKCLAKSDPNCELHADLFPSPSYIQRYLHKLGFKTIDGNDIAPPYDFGYYTVRRPESLVLAVKRTKRRYKRVVRYGARCGHCSRFVQIRNRCAEGGFLSYIDYFRHWISFHYDRS